MKHLAILSGDAIEKIFSGEKRVEARFSQRRIPPFGFVSSGDVVLMKKPGKKIQGQFEVERVLSLDNPQDEDLKRIKKDYKNVMVLEDDFWYRRGEVKYVTLIFIGNVSPFLVSPQIEKKDLRGWVVLG